MIFHSEKQSIHQTFSIFNKTISFLMLMLFIGLTGCGSGESNISLGNRTGILYWGNGTEPASLDPHIATGVPEHHIMSSVMEGLVLKDRKSLEPRPGVAESWTISDDGRVYTFKLRDDARWSNGDPHIASDYVWSWWRALQPALGNQYAYMLFPIKNSKRYYDFTLCLICRSLRFYYYLLFFKKCRCTKFSKHVKNLDTQMYNTNMFIKCFHMFMNFV